MAKFVDPVRVSAGSPQRKLGECPDDTQLQRQTENVKVVEHVVNGKRHRHTNCPDHEGALDPTSRDPECAHKLRGRDTKEHQIAR